MRTLRLAVVLGAGAAISAAHADSVGSAWVMAEYEIAGETTYRLDGTCRVDRLPPPATSICPCR
jgi:hypothetical protein